MKDVKEVLKTIITDVTKIINFLKNELPNASKEKDYEKAKFIIEKTEMLKDFKTKLDELKKDYEENFPTEYPQSQRITPDRKFKVPILESLVELGGKATRKDVLNKVYEKMKNILTKADMEKVPSGSDIRWRNSASFCRKSMVDTERLLKKNSPKGIWEITEKGKKYLKEAKEFFGRKINF
ncbi:MAG: winged helix-turn-helix domain-containing protein [Candidatus Helarchaeota archaeon]